MKQLLPALATLVALSAAAAPVAPKTPAEVLRDIDSYEPLSKVRVNTPPKAFPTRSLDDPQAEFDATFAEYWNYGDLLENGTNVYMLLFSNVEMSKGLPLGEGQMCRLEVIAEAPANLSDPFPGGTYSYIDLESDEPVAGSLVGADSDFLDAFVNPDDPASGQLVAFSWTVTAGSVTVDYNPDVYDPDYWYYTVSSDALRGEITDSDTGEVLDSRDLSVTFSGGMQFVDPNAYTPLGEDVAMNIPGLSGRYTEGGGWTLTFYGVELDQDGFIVGPGDLFNVELYTEDPGFMDCEKLPGTYTACDLFATGGVAGCYGQGVWYDFYGMYIPIGTNLSIYNDYLDIERVGLAESGEITISKVSDDIYHFDFNVVSFEGDKMTGSWEGCVKDYVVDFSPGSVAETGLGSNGAVKAGRGYIEAPEGARVFNAAGIETGTRDLAPGIYIVRLADRALKVVVK